MHELPQLGKLERAYPDGLVVIGVQSAKYPAEGQPDNLRDAIHRYGITHPVVNDPDYKIWDAYAVKAWPTLVFISPSGEVIGSHSGEAPFEALAPTIDALIAEYEREGTLVRGPIGLDTETYARPTDELLFPGKVLASGRHLFIADSGHNRLIVARQDGAVTQVIGSGEAGLRDGEAGDAQFFRPQGLALHAASQTLYVADADNHAIRAVDLVHRRVRTVAGTGEQLRRMVRGGPALRTALSSPWDLALETDRLFIAMAGLHQIWTLDVSGETLSVWAGTGHEALRDGPRESAWLAQPMGLSLSGGRLYVACAEAQAVRAVDLASGTVTTLAGRGLFAFGDEDGPSGEALLQHNQDVECIDGVVYVADTYNNKVKAVRVDADEVATVAGSGAPGYLDGPGAHARLREPAGLSASSGVLYIADTNNHLVRSVGLEAGIVQTVRFADLS